MKRVVLKEEDLSTLPIPELGYKTLGVSGDGNLSMIDHLGDITEVGGVSNATHTGEVTGAMVKKQLQNQITMK